MKNSTFLGALLLLVALTAIGVAMTLKGLQSQGLAHCRPIIGGTVCVLSL